MSVANAGVYRAPLAARLREPGARAAQLLALTGFALVQPVLDILGKNAAFFAVRGSSATDIVFFALALTLAPPAVLLVAELVAALVVDVAADVLHLLFVGGLAGVVVLHAITKADALDGAAAILVAALAGGCVAAIYRATSFARSFLTVLGAAPLVFLVLFLFFSPVSKLVFPEDVHAATGAVNSKTPVVLVVFDEFPTVSLMDRTGRIDARRWPNFAALARDATWFRNSTTVHPHTEQAVPAILTGQLPDRGKLPIFADHPQNVFTLLGRRYRVRAIEALTHLCPPSLCKKTKAERFDASASDETSSLAYDVGVVYLHLVLPERYASHLPPISNTWGNFGSKGGAEDAARRSGGGAPVKTVPACARNICKLASLVAADRKPSLYFAHSLLPHVPWLYLPSGKRYGGDVRVIPGSPNGKWSSDPWLGVQAKQRYLLQLGYTDAAIGLLLKRLRATGVYDRALIIVTADHGVSFRPNTPRRNVSRANLRDLAFQPLFVKAPRQKRGRIDDGFARTIDIVPTIAHVLHARIPWHVDGQSLLGRRLPPDGTVDVAGVRAPLRTLVAERAQDLRDQVATFGTGSLERVYRIGTNRALLGKPVASLAVRPSAATGVELSGRELLSVVDLSTDFLPNYITGTITGSHPRDQALAVAVNGTIRAVTRSYTEFGATRFAALVPERSLEQGANDVAVYAVAGTASRPVLETLRGTEVTYSLGAGALQASNGQTIRVTDAISGEVTGARSTTGVTFGGWAADLQARRAAGTIAIFAGDRSVYVARNGNIPRNDVRSRYGVAKAGFLYRLPSALLPAPTTGEQVRVFAIAGGVASELRYARGYPWPTGR